MANAVITVPARLRYAPTGASLANSWRTSSDVVDWTTIVNAVPLLTHAQFVIDPIGLSLTCWR